MSYTLPLRQLKLISCLGQSHVKNALSTQTWTTVGPDQVRKQTTKCPCAIHLWYSLLLQQEPLQKQYVAFDKIEGAGGRGHQLSEIRSSCKPLRPGLSVNRFFPLPCTLFNNLLQITRAQPKPYVWHHANSIWYFLKIQLKRWKHAKQLSFT